MEFEKLSLPERYLPVKYLLNPNSPLTINSNPAEASLPSPAPFPTMIYVSFPRNIKGLAPQGTETPLLPPMLLNDRLLYNIDFFPQ